MANGAGQSRKEETMEEGVDLSLINVGSEE